MLSASFAYSRQVSLLFSLPFDLAKAPDLEVKQMRSFNFGLPTSKTVDYITKYPACSGQVRPHVPVIEFGKQRQGDPDCKIWTSRVYTKILSPKGGLFANVCKAPTQLRLCTL